MKRRALLKAAAGSLAAGGLFAPSLGRAQNAKVLRFVPQANLANLDPIWTTLYVVRNASVLFWDTLYGLNSHLEPKPQMVEAHEVSEDGLVWNFRLRPGLRFHDNEPVRAIDVKASLDRWMVRDNMGQIINARLDALEVVGDRSFRFRLKQPFPKMLFALGKVGTPVAFIMPERMARTDPYKQVSEYIGSGPFRFKRDEWVPGSQAVFEKFEGYVPREEPADWLAGGKRVSFDRVEWKVIPDAATAAGALQNGEVDWWENPIPDLVPIMSRNSSVIIDLADPLGNIGDCRFNHLYPPFDDVRVRRAVLMAANQADYMQALVGDNQKLWQESASFFTPGTPLYTEHGGEILKQKNIAGAKKLVGEAGHKGTKVVMLVGTDQPISKSQGDVTADLLEKIGLVPDYIATDWGTLGARRASREPVAKGGWNMFFTWHAGVDCVNPGANPAYYTTGERAWFGWPKSEDVQRKIEAWFAATDVETEKLAIREINRAEMDFATFLPSGFFKGYQAWRKNLSGIVQAPFPVVWGVTKT
ncbi:MAG: ABC transporter substrate-binding protein [Acetobacteraceae bacterium]|nr:ABC transporter substrate-binding protein [Acetobacteraceae bacterium]MBV8588625.1 ABC transporter substrate-binding protein [Acetobacteraceae bacterium]